MNHIIRRGSQKLGDDGELVDVVLAREQRLALQHLCEDTTGAPDIHLHVVLLPCEHDLGSPVVSRRDVSGHLGILDAREAEVADLEVAVLIDQDVAGLEIAMDDACGVNIFQATLESWSALRWVPGLVWICLPGSGRGSIV